MSGGTMPSARSHIAQTEVGPATVRLLRNVDSHSRLIGKSAFCLFFARSPGCSAVWSIRRRRPDRKSAPFSTVTPGKIRWFRTVSLQHYFDIESGGRLPEPPRWPPPWLPPASFFAAGTAAGMVRAAANLLMISVCLPRSYGSRCYGSHRHQAMPAPPPAA